MSKTKRDIARSLVALTALLIAFAFQTPAQASQAALPQVAIESARHDFGEAFVGEELMHVFIVRNTGDAPLELSQKRLLAIRRPTSIRARIIRVGLTPANASPG
ncbi:MAG TPA: hypothetical protein VFQ92_07375 [Blastocatellia bacterium]|nr:hypothetical protein [Blastocatellia bacterium]